MNIGIDIDDTISNSFETYFEDSQIYDIETMKGTGKVKDLGKIPSDNIIETMYDWDDEATLKFWDKYFIKVLKYSTPRFFASEAIKKLKEEGNNIYIITARYEQDGINEGVKNLTVKWLKTNNIYYDELIMNADDKLEVSKKYNIDVFIDDSLKNCIEVSKGDIKVLHYAGLANFLVDTGAIPNVYSWQQIYDLLKKKD